jgi:hypothetical protein
MLKLSRSELRYIILRGRLFDISYSTWLWYFNNLRFEFVSDPLDPFSHNLNQPFDTDKYCNYHIESNIDCNCSNHYPPSLIAQFRTRIKEAREHQTWIGYSQDAKLIENFLKLSELIIKRLIMQEVPEEDERLEEH